MSILRSIGLAAGLAAAACEGRPPTGPTATAQIQITANPSPIVPAICPPSSCGPLVGQLEATTTLTIRESGGIGGTVESATQTLRRNSDGLVLANATGTLSAVRFVANQSTTVPTGVHYEQALGSGAATLTIVITARDDNGRAVNATLAIPVAAFTP